MEATDVTTENKKTVDQLHVLLFSNEFPRPGEPNRGIFTGQLAYALAKQINIEVMCPFPWRPGRLSMQGGPTLHQDGDVACHDSWKGVPVQYVGYPMIPWLGRPIQPALLCSGIYPALSKANRKSPFTTINAHWVYPDGVAAAWIGRRLGIPVVVTALGSDVNQYSFYRTRRPQVMWALRHSARVTCVSEALKDQLVCLGAEADRIDVIPNGVDGSLFHIKNLNRVEAKKRLGLDPGHRHLLYVGRLAKEKGPSLLCEAIRILAEKRQLDFQTIFLGDGQEKDSLKQYITAYRIESHVRLLGEVPHEQIAQWLRAGDWLCLPSTREGMPNAMLEALSCGLPVIASKVGGVPEVISDRNGLLVKPGDPKALANALERATKRQWDGEKVASTVRDWSWDTVASGYVKSILKALEYETSRQFERH
jgi:glycosyltransferase involved in cell wall biosynthesis